MSHSLWLPWTAAGQAPLSSTISWNLFKFMSTELMMPSNHLILCHHFLLLPSTFPSIRVFSREKGLGDHFSPAPGALWASQVAQMVKCLPAMWETRVWSLGREDPLEKEMAIHSSTLVWKILWMEEPSRLQSMGSQRVGHDWAISLSFLSGALASL